MTHGRLSQASKWTQLLRACAPARPRAHTPAHLRACAPARLRACAPARLRACAPARSMRTYRVRPSPEPPGWPPGWPPRRRPARPRPGRRPGRRPGWPATRGAVGRTALTGRLTGCSAARPLTPTVRALLDWLAGCSSVAQEPGLGTYATSAHLAGACFEINGDRRIESKLQQDTQLRMASTIRVSAAAGPWRAAHF